MGSLIRSQGMAKGEHTVMSGHAVTVHQLQAQGYGERRRDTAFFNVDDEYGSVSVTTTVSLPTYLVCQDYVVQFIQFNGVDSARDWFTRHQHYITWVKRIDRVKEDKSMKVVDVELDSLLIPRDNFLCPEILGEERPTAKEKLEKLAYGLRGMDNEVDNEIGNDILSILQEL